ncbi:MAG: GNAT family N-acetyltransferase [Magnetospirillum sp.]|nr:GNAT family N-acetyltransferase [Magnetospirillum sp.]
MTRLRLATAADVADDQALIRELAAFEGGSVRSTPDDLLRDGFGPQPRFEVLLAEEAGAVVGMLVFFPVYSTWEGRPGVMIHDLFVRSPARGRGIAKALVRHLAALAVERGCTRMDVNVLDWNEPARRFYQACGLVLDSGWLRHRAAGADLRRLAE